MSKHPCVCPGCGEPPIDVGNFGRHKFACRRYAGRSPETTKECVGGVLRPMYRAEREAIDCWHAAIEWWPGLIESARDESRKDAVEIEKESAT